LHFNSKGLALAIAPWKRISARLAGCYKVIRQQHTSMHAKLMRCCLLPTGRDDWC